MGIGLSATPRNASLNASLQKVFGPFRPDMVRTEFMSTDAQTAFGVTWAILQPLLATDPGT